MSLRMKLWALRRTLGLSPTQKLFRELKRRGVDLASLDAVEMFAHTGFLHTKDYQPLVRSLEAWELDPSKEPELKQNLPGATVRITDTYQEVRTTPRRFGLVLADAPDCCHGLHDEYCEHFDILPELFRIVTASPVLILNVMPGEGQPSHRIPPQSAKHRERRRVFYGTEHPERIPVAEMLPAYKRIIETHGFIIDWYFSAPRTRDGRLHYLVMKLQSRR